MRKLFKIGQRVTVKDMGDCAGTDGSFYYGGVDDRYGTNAIVTHYSNFDEYEGAYKITIQFDDGIQYSMLESEVYSAVLNRKLDYEYL